MTRYLKQKGREKFIKKERELDEAYTGPGRRLPLNRGFLDREGEVVHPDRAEYEYASKRRYPPRKYHGIVSIAGFALGLAFLSSTFFSSNIQLSPGQNAINWNLWAGIILIVVSLVEGYLWFKIK